MLFNKDHDVKKEMKDIKDAIEEEPHFDEELAPPAPFKPFEQEQSAPLFVKVEKYHDVISGIQEMKLFVAAVKDIFAIMQELEQVRNDALNIMKVTVQRLEKSVVEMDAELLRPRGVSISPFPQGKAEAKHIESSLAELQKQLIELKQELRGMR
ncbi:MAG: hypothetical protein HY514_01170 [Candidatus Aenigmarchaeota archaeon]|nr:hypothetical protein [Candidatus Aenigmarchaeota archaeon]